MTGGPGSAGEAAEWGMPIFPGALMTPEGRLLSDPAYRPVRPGATPAEARRWRRAWTKRQLVLDCKRDAQAFCKRALWEEDPRLRRRFKVRLAGYARAAGWLREVLRARDRGKLTEDALEQFEKRMNAVLQKRPVTRTLTHLWRGAGAAPFFFYESDEGAHNGVQHLAYLLTSHARAITRFRVCGLGPDECERLFWDGPPRGDRNTCCKRHKDLKAQRKHREKGRDGRGPARGAA